MCLCVHENICSSIIIKYCMFILDCVQAQVLYDFSAEVGNNELTVKEGETLTITNKVNLYQHASNFLLVFSCHFYFYSARLNDFLFCSHHLEFLLFY